MSGFKKATKAAAKLRAAVFGPSGAGKTFTSLRIATGLGGRIAVIDTEGAKSTRNDGTVVEIPSAAKYCDRFDFDVQILEDKSIDGYTAAIQEAGDAGYDVLVIDSLSHSWQWLTEEVEKIAKLRYRGNTWSAWSEGTPMQRRLLQAIISFPGHVVVTMRSRTDWNTADSNGKKVPNRVGLAPEQGKGIEYEFDLLVEISTDHIANVIKDRTGKFQDKLIEKPGEQFGRELAAWLAEGTRVQAPVEKSLFERVSDYIAAAKDVRSLGKIGDRIDELSSEGQLTSDQVSDLLVEIDKRHEVLEPKTNQETTHAV